MEVGLTVGGWFAAKVIGELISLGTSYAKDQYKWQTGMKEELKRLEMARPKIEAVVAAADQGHIKDPTGGLKAWMWQLKDAADEANDVLDEFEYWYLEKQVRAGKNNKVRDAASRFKKIMKRAVKQDPTLKSLKKAVKKLDKAAAEVGDFFALVDHSAAKLQQQGQQYSEIKNTRQTSSSLKSKVSGRKNESDKMVKKLLITNPGSTESDVLVISGMGGVGKTTLAQYVLADKRVKEHFDLKSWICVSDIFDVTMLTRKILESVTGEAPSVTTFDMLQKKLLEVLLTPIPTPTPTPTATEQTTTTPTLKRFLLVLDDVWNAKDWASWENLLAPLRNVNYESKIVVTTRTAAVANVIKGGRETYPLKGLSDADCSSVLMEYAFDGENPDDHPGLRLIGVEIAKKLKGSPLAAKTIGGLLRSNLNDGHWRGILNSDILKLEQSEGDIMPALRLSYDHLPAHLKSCFAYCSIFPQDQVFEKDDLVHMWVAAGLIQHDVNETPEDVGTRYFEDLRQRYFFDQSHTEDYNTMHDLIHDLARLVSAGECFRLPLGADSKDIPPSVRHLSVTINCNNPSVLDIVCKSTNLRTLHLSLLGDHTDEIGPALKILFKKLRSLRVLELHTYNKEFPIPDSIGELIRLRYLKSYIYPLPESVFRLYHLQFIFLRNFRHPVLVLHTWNLINLRCVNTHPNTKPAIASIGKLTRLQQLEEFAVEREDGYMIGELKDMNMLRKLGICNLENVTSCEEACEANLKVKECLNTLQLQWGSDNTVIPDMDEKVLNGLQPHSNLMELTIINYNGARSPCWIKANILSQLTHLYLRYGEGWVHLPPLGQLPFLKVLHFIYMVAITRIGPDLYGVGKDDVFRVLQELVFDKMPQMIEWSIEEDGRLYFPDLRILRVKSCLDMKVWPAALPRRLTELDILTAGLTTLPPCLSMPPPSSSSSSSSSSSLSSLSIGSCPNLESVAEGLLQHKLLKHLKIEHCSEVQALAIDPGHLPLFPSLETLYLSGCGELDRSLPVLLQGATSLQKLELRWCDHIISLPLGGLGTLRELIIRYCSELVSLDGFQDLVSLERLDIRGCPKLATTDTVPEEFAPPLAILDIDYLSLQVMLPALSGVTSLTILRINECFASFSAEFDRWLWQNGGSIQNLHFAHAIPWETSGFYTSYQQYQNDRKVWNYFHQHTAVAGALVD